MDLLAPYLGDYPEGADGAPETKLSITPGVGDTMQIELEMTGYLDDSVAGEKFFGQCPRRPGRLGPHPALALAALRAGEERRALDRRQLLLS